MKKNKLGNIILLCIPILIVISILIIGLTYLEHDSWKKILYELMLDLLSAILVSMILGSIIKIITNKLFSVDIDIKKLRDAGIQGIGTGKSTDIDVLRMFGTSIPKKKYPTEIKMLFLTGNVFLSVFEDKIVKCLNEGTIISLLITSPAEENHSYLKRSSERFSDGKIDYVDEIINDSLVTIKRIKDRTTKPENLKIRFYLDEYQNNIRISRYLTNSEQETTYFWINVQPISKPAKDLSIALKSVYKSKDILEQEKSFDKDLCRVSEKGFDKLWDKYEYTESICNKLLS